MKPTKEHIREMAEFIDCGEICFFHQLTGMIEHYPDPNSEYFEPELWQKTMDKIDSDWSNYQKIEKMDPRQGFRIMEEFANSITDTNFQSRLFELLTERKPFSKFKLAVDNSNYRQNWFDFKEQANIKWVCYQLTDDEQHK
jgi:hypothetical protein